MDIRKFGLLALPVIAILANATTADAKDWRKKVSDYMAKPVTTKDITVNTGSAVAGAVTRNPVGTLGGLFINTTRQAGQAGDAYLETYRRAARGQNPWGWKR